MANRNMLGVARRCFGVVQKVSRIAWYRHRRLFGAAAVCAVVLVAAGLWSYQNMDHYQLSDNERKLLSSSSVDASKVTFKDGHLSYNAKDEKKDAITVASPSNATGQYLYRTNLSQSAKDGIEFSDSGSDLPLKLIPIDGVGNGHYDNGRMVYSSKGGKVVYTLRKNGIKGDILLSKAPGNELTYSWKLDLGGQLEAKMLPDGSVGIYSSNPLLYSSGLTVGDKKSQDLIDNAKKNGAKDNLMYVLPRPYFKDSEGKTSNDNVSFSLKDNVLTLKASNLKSKKYPLSIDPTIVVTTTADFRAGYDDGNIDYATTDEIKRGNVSLGTLGTFASVGNTFPRGRTGVASIAYDGYFYIAGGFADAASGTCSASRYCNDVQYAQINSNGTLNSFATAGTFTNARQKLGVSIYNGYFYIAGGGTDTGAGNCSNTYCNDVIYAAINSSTGALGSFATAGTFTNERNALGAAVYNGYFYIAGGLSPSATNNCSASGYCNDVQYAAINADGTLGSFALAGTFTTPRQKLGVSIYNGYFYIAGGQGNTATGNCNNGGTGTCNDVQYAAINADGTLGSFALAGTFTTARRELAVTSANGHFYIAGGSFGGSSGNCTDTISGGENLCSDTLYAPINADGTLGTFTTTNTFTNPRMGSSAAFYNGYFYIAGGISSSSTGNCNNINGSFNYCNDVQFAQINTGTPTFGTIGSFSTANTFTNARADPNVAAYNGYFYIAGGISNIGANNCNTGFGHYCNDVIYAQINANGTLGTFATAGTFTDARADLGVAAYNGYFYVAGGYADNINCNNSGSNDCNDVQYAQINANGTLGTFASTASFTNARHDLGALAYNGYFYIAGGGGSCPPTAYCNDVQYAQINSNGTLGTFASAGTLTQSRYALAISAYNGYFYAAGGQSDGACNGATTYCSDVIYAQINSNGTLNSFASAGTFTNARYFLSAAAYNGYFYIAGGASNSITGNCSTSGSCNDVQYAQINSNGTLGTFALAGTFTNPRAQLAATAYNGYFYIAGGNSSSGTNNCNNGTNHTCNDVQSVQIKSPEQASTYEKIVDVGTGAATGFNFHGRAVCGMAINYRSAGSNGVFGSTTNIPFGLPGTTYTVSGGARYIWLQFKLNDASCGTNSQITDINVNYNNIPASATLSVPSAGATGVSATPLFQLRTTDADNDYLQYKIELCTTSNCSSVLRTIDQTSSQTGWSGQDAGPGSNTAYTGNATITSSTLASYTYQLPPLSASTQYWWRAYAIDPAGTNSFNTASAIQTFTTGNDTPSTPTLIAPTSAQAGQSTLLDFQLRSYDLNSDYLRYAIKVYSTQTECNADSATNLVRHMDQTSSQTGWSSQDVQTGSAYASTYTLSGSSIAHHFYQTPGLSPNTTYWWKARAVDPGGSNTWSAWATCQSFTTSNQETRLQGTTRIQGTTKIGN